MDLQGFEAYRVLIQRKEKALYLGTEVREKFCNQYREICEKLKKGWKEYLVFFLTDGNEKTELTEKDLKGLPPKDSEQWKEILACLNAGELEKMDRLLIPLREIVRKNQAECKTGRCKHCSEDGRCTKWKIEEKNVLKCIRGQLICWEE